MNRIYLILLFLIPTITSCSDIALTSDQQTFAVEFNTLIDQVASPLSPAEINARFFSSGGQLSAATYILLGENHVDLPTLIDQARVFQTLLQPDDVILFEGNRAGLQTDCVSGVIFTLYAVKKWNELGRPYDPDQFDAFRQSLRHFYDETFGDLNLNKLNFRGVTCYFWDNVSALDLPINKFSLTQRNTTMVTELGQVSGSVFSHIFVKAGARHLPSGDLDYFKNLYTPFSILAAAYYSLTTPQLLALTLSNFYSLLGTASDPRALTDISKFGFGSTLPIYNYLRFRNYTELIPASLIKASMSCDLGCD